MSDRRTEILEDIEMFRFMAEKVRFDEDRKEDYKLYFDMYNFCKAELYDYDFYNGAIDNFNFN